MTATHVAMCPHKPDLLDVNRPADGRRRGLSPKMVAEEGATFIDGDGVTAKLNVGVVGDVRQLQRILKPADRTYRVPHADKPWLAIGAAHCGFELSGELAVLLKLFLTAISGRK